MWRSLIRVHPSARLHVLCLDDACLEILEGQRLQNVCLHDLRALEAADPELSRARGNRQLLEYYFTLTPCWPRHLLLTEPEIQRLTYLDADVFFLADPQVILDEMGDASIGVVEHRFPEHLASLVQYGRFNVGWLTFTRDATSRLCLDEWRQQCLDWCFDRAEDGRFAEQKYLDEWPSRFERVHVIQHPGANVAPWNLGRYDVASDGDGIVRVNGDQVLFFHAHGFVPAGPGRERRTNLETYGVSATDALMRGIFDPYERALQAAIADLAEPLASALHAQSPCGLERGYREPVGRLSTTSDEDASGTLLHRIQALERDRERTSREMSALAERLRTAEATVAVQAQTLSQLQTQVSRMPSLPAVRFSPPFEPVFRGWIDEPAAAPQACRFVLRGWCYRTDGTAVDAVRATDGRSRFVGSYGLSRPDVWAHFDGEPASDRCGYQIAVLASRGPVTFTIEARLPDGSWQPVQSVDIPAPWGDTAVPRLRRAQFWWRAWLGNPTAFGSLSRLETDWLMAHLSARSGLTLKTEPQHAPRARRPERFPRMRHTIDRLPRFAVVTPSFNQATFLERTLTSVLDQPGVHVEYVVPDGGSTDGSVEILRRYAGRLSHWHSGADAGQAAAIVEGFGTVSIGRDDLMLYLNSDDELMPGALQFVASYFANHPEVDVVYGHRVLVDEQSQEVGRWFTPRNALDQLHLVDVIPQETMVWRKRAWDAVGGIDRTFAFAMDWDLLLRFKAAGLRFARLPYFLAAFRMHSQQKTQARMSDTGVPEMDALRRRTLGREATVEELQRASYEAGIDSILVGRLFGYGIRA